MSSKKQTAVDWLAEQNLWNEFHNPYLEQAKQMEKELAHEYAEFAIRCDRMEMKILNFEDWIKL